MHALILFASTAFAAACETAINQALTWQRASLATEIAQEPASTQASIESVFTELRAEVPGVTSAEIDRAGRSVMARAGIDEEFRHRAGYSMGVAFAPGWGEGLVNDIAEGNDRPLEPGMTFHLVPMAGFRGEGNMGFSETVLVTESGCEVLTDVPRELHVTAT